MDSQKKQATEEDYLSSIFPDFKSEWFKINDWKYFDLPKVGSLTKTPFSKKENKPQITMSEWFENLSISQRVEAASTIFDKENKILENIKLSLDKLLKFSQGAEINLL